MMLVNESANWKRKGALKEVRKTSTITLEPPWWRCENGNEFRCGANKPARCPVCGSTNIELVPDVDAVFLPAQIQEK
jgi:predicted Zn-ribbon and HTH transcriptional regulator